MKTLTFLLLVLIANITISWAQQETPTRYVNPEWEVLNGAPNTELNIYTLTRKGKRLENRYVFNQYGLLADGFTIKRNGKLRNHYATTYNTSKKQVKRIHYKHNKLNYMTTFTYTSDTLLVRSNHFSKDSLLAKSTSYYTYTPDGKYATIRVIDNKNKEAYAFEYDYYENGSRKETRHYRKGKLQYRWTYDCKPEGELTPSNNKSGSICKNRTYAADSSFTETNDAIKKGKLTRTIVRADAEGHVLEFRKFNAKGKQISHLTYQYNSERKLIQRNSYKKNSNRIAYSELYEYNQLNCLVSSSKIDEKGSVKYKRMYSYN
jgi:hypothetical protein